MFIEIRTKRNELVMININQILFFTPNKNGTLIVDIIGNEYSIEEPYSDFKHRFNTFISLK